MTQTTAAVKRLLISPKGRAEYNNGGGTGNGSTVVNSGNYTVNQTIVQGGGSNQQLQAGANIVISGGRINAIVPQYTGGTNVVIEGNAISSPNSVQSATCKKIVSMKKSDYESLAVKDANTLYLVYEPQPISASCIYQQIQDVSCDGATITDGILPSYFTWTAALHFSDGSEEDISEDVYVYLNDGPFDISANTTDMRIVAARPLVNAAYNYSGSTSGSTTGQTFQASAYVSFFQEALQRTWVNTRLVGTWAVDVPASGGTITSANCTWDVYYIYNDGTEELHTHYPSLYYPINIPVEANTTGSRRALDSFTAMITVHYPNGGGAYIQSNNITPYQAG